MLKERIPKYFATTGDTVYLVGGAVRDLLCDRQPTDFDIAVLDHPGFKASQLALAVKGHLVKLGRDPFPLFRVVHRGGTIDVSAIKGGGIEADLRQRDFTINAMAYDLTDHKLIDPLNGASDLKEQVVRTASPDCFSQDPARLVRAHRIAAGLNFTIDSDTSRRIAQHAALIHGIPGERIWPELQAVFLAPNCSLHLNAMKANGLLAALIPEARWRRKADGRHSLDMVAGMENIINQPETHLPEEAIHFIENLSAKKRILSKMALLLHDMGNRCDYVSDRAAAIYDGAGTDIQRNEIIAICRRLRTATYDCNWIAAVVGHHRLPMLAHQYPGKVSIGRFFKQCGAYAPYVLMHCLAETQTIEKRESNKSIGIKDTCKKLIKLYFNKIEGMLRQAPLVGGRELMDALELKPSRLVGELSAMLDEARLEGRIESKDQALKLARDFMDSRRES